MKIQVRIKQVYGRDAIYPACEASKIFAQMAKATTLTPNQIGLIKALGYTIEVVQDVVTL